MQVAQILQVLVVSKREDIDPKVSDLYSKFQVVDNGKRGSLLGRFDSLDPI